MPDVRVRFSWDLELADVDNDADLDLLVSCKRCGGSHLFRNDGTGTFTDDPRGLPQYTNNYEFEPMDLDGDGFLDLVTINDGEIVGGKQLSRREHVFRNDGKGRFRDVTDAWWPPAPNVGEDDNMVAFLDYDSDGDADFVVGSLSGPDRLLINDGRGHLTVRLDVFDGEATPGTLGLALADLDGDGRMDVVQGQGEHKTAIDERVFSGRGLAPRHRAAVGDDGRRGTGTGGRVAWCARASTIARARAWRPSGSGVVVEWTTPAGRARSADAMVRRVPVARRLAGRSRRTRPIASARPTPPATSAPPVAAGNAILSNPDVPVRVDPRGHAREHSATPPRAHGSGDDVVQHRSRHVRQPEVAAAVLIGQLGVIDAHQVQDRGVQVVHVHRLLDRLEPEVVGRAVGDAALHAAAGEPHAEPERVVIAAALIAPALPPTSTTGVRPNSDPHTTSVSSNRPRDFRSLITAANG